MRKLVLIILSIFLLVNPSFANEYNKLVRVGISSNNFKHLYYSSISIGGYKKYTIYNKDNGEDIVTVSPYKWTRITFSDGKFNIFIGGNLVKKCINASLGIKSEGLLRVQGLKRKGKPALYRGEFELTKAYTNCCKFNLINILPLEEYLKGVVPNEIPISFGLEAIKAQAVAARNYTLRPRVKVYHNFDVCDTVQSQVYFGANTEQDLATQAVKETDGLFAIYDGEVILAVYSSTAGGHSENFENVFTSPVCNEFPSTPVPYLKGRSDYPLTKGLDLSTNEGAKGFYTSKPESFDDESKYYRWEREWTRCELENVLCKTLKSYSGSGFVQPAFTSSSCFGTLKSIKVLSRGVSGKVISLEVKTSKGTWVVKKELIIRRIFKKNYNSLPSANFVVLSTCSSDCGLSKIKFVGGGFGHGVGMSQYGAGKMAHSDSRFDEILQHYYTGISIGTYPLYISDKLVEVDFVSPKSEGYLMIDNPEKVENFTFKINGVEINLDKSFLLKKNRLKLNKYIEKNNTVEFMPLDESGKKLKVWIEVFRAKN